MVFRPGLPVRRYRIRRYRRCTSRTTAALLTAALTLVLSSCARPSDRSVPSPDSTHGVDGTVAGDPDTCQIGTRHAYLGHLAGYVTRLEKLREAVRARLDSGEATTTDLAQVQARLADARARLVRARADLAIARAELAAATGRHRPCPPTP